MKELIKVYRNLVKENQKDIDKILASFDPFFKGIVKKEVFYNLFLDSSNLIARKWESNKKHARTFFIVKAFGKYYPKKVFSSSLLADALVNILDDLIDESLSEKEKTLYVLEFLRVFALHQDLFPPQANKSFRIYLQELINVAVSEAEYQKYLKKRRKITLDEFVKLSWDLLEARARDIDIFTDLTLLDEKDKRKKNYIKEASRILRALTIVKKDLLDIDHDLSSGITTFIILTLKMKFDLNLYLENLLVLAEDKVKPIELFIKRSTGRSKVTTVLKNFISLIREEEKEITKIGRNYAVRNS